MKVVITVVGKDAVGILAKVSTACAERGVNIVEVSQSILQDMFCMIMIAEIDESNKDCFGDLSGALTKLGTQQNLAIHVMHEDIFNSMHRI
jgi:ACT domain-containing protein